ncbi:MAG: PAS domain S-box protein [Deltaproteobacteria bacterium]|nr:PAS domain S-box protein [Deltaproteobacteria bacterium]
MNKGNVFMGANGPLVIILLANLLIIAVGILGYQSYKTAERTAIEEFNERQLTLANSATRGIELYFKNISENLTALGEMQGVQNFNEFLTRQKIKKVFDKLTPLGANDIGVLDAKGFIRYNVMAPQIEGMNFSWRNFFKAIKDPDFTGSYVSQFIKFIGAGMGQKGVIIAVPMFANRQERTFRSNSITCVVFCTVKLDDVTQKFLTPLESSQQGSVILIDEEYNVLWSPDGERGLFTIDDEKNLIAYAPVRIGNNVWSIGLWTPKEDIKKLIRPAYIELAFLAGFSILAITLGTLMPLILSARITRRLEQEIRSRKESEYSLRRSKEFIETVLDSMTDAISIIDVKNHKIIDVNQVFLEQAGLDKKDVIGEPCYKITHHRNSPCTPPDDMCPLKDAAETGTDIAYEHKNYRKDGGKKFAEVRAHPIRDERGAITQVVHVSRNITTRKKTEETLKKYAKDLEETNRLKDLFLDIMTHDILNPTIAIMGVARLEQVIYPENERIKLILESSKRIEDIVENAQILSKIKALSWFEKEPLDLKRVIDSECKNCKHLFDQAGIKIASKIKMEMQIDANPMIRLVFYNLLTNAVKYAAEGKILSVDAKEERGFYNIQVIDHGPGIPHEYKEGLFNRFRQKKKDGIKGIGLGLAIVKRLIDLHNGKVWVEDNPMGGSIFNVCLPKKL